MSRQTWTKELRRVVNRLETNKDGLVKVTSAIDWLLDNGGDKEVLEEAKFALMQERRNLRLDFCDELDRQDKWKKGAR
ncbi:hypothetical protein Acid345_3180 [Candidatus Koribacter versatilis Ellin345]|uniref:Uncharacterized protein n=1 Tax=Koribacter versatilis (strain Ellin345) TaxID=204669 RepID=Q1ILR9_KORVE|nr:hypothetical protein [Candidatus Koribacter versatilis]ABF42181.1 hypothetical protein Acid345_3180 [Candidatus Koribacter versatilis Ellin345]